MGGAEELWSGTNWGDVEWCYGAMGAVRWSLASTGELCDGAVELWPWDGPVELFVGPGSWSAVGRDPRAVEWNCTYSTTPTASPQVPRAQ